MQTKKGNKVKLDVKSILIGLLVAYISYNFFFNVQDISIKDETIITKPKTGKVEKKVDSIIRDTVYIKVEVPGKSLPAKKEIIVDSLYKSKYEEAIKANDSLVAKNLFLEAISINEYQKVLIDDKNIRIDGKVTTRGTLLDYDISYTIKSDTIIYTPKIYTKYPNLSLILGMRVSPPITSLYAPANNPLVISGDVGFQNKKGDIFTIGYGTDRRFTLGFKKSFKLSKK